MLATPTAKEPLKITPTTYFGNVLEFGPIRGWSPRIATKNGNTIQSDSSFDVAGAHALPVVPEVQVGPVWTDTVA